MTENMHELAARKRLLLARSALVRLQIRHQLMGMRTSRNWVAAGVQAAKSGPVRSALFALLLSRLGQHRVGRWVVIAGKTVLFAKMASVALDISRSLRHSPGTSLKKTR